MLRSLFLCLSLLAFVPGSIGALAKVDPKAVLVESFRGWGTSLCWWTNVVGGFENHEEFADAIFTDLRLTIVRYNIGGGENPAYPDLPGDMRARMEGLQSEDGEWNPDADTNQRRMLKAALARGVTHVDAFSNSPPWWMTDSKSVTGGLIPITDNLSRNAEKDFAAYLVEVMAFLAREDGVRFDTISPMNEPLSPWWFGNRQEGCHMSIDQQVRVLDHLHAALEKAGMTIGLVAPETFSTDEAIRALEKYPEPLRRQLRAVATHGYDTKKANELRKLAGDTPVWISEHGDGDASGLETARAILDALNVLRAEEWVYWQAVEPDNGWGLLVNALDGKSTEWKTTPRYTVLRQFTNFIPPGSRILSTNDRNSVAAISPEGDLTVIALNDTEAETPFTMDVSATDLKSRIAKVVRTSPSARFTDLPDLEVTGGILETVLPPRSLTTFVLPDA